ALAGLIDDLLRLSFNSDRQGVQIFVDAFTSHMAGWVDQAVARQFLYNTWLASDHHALPCSLGYKCVWEAARTFRTGGSIGLSTFALLFDPTNAINTNQLSIYYQEYMPLWFDAHLLCSESVASISDVL